MSKKNPHRRILGVDPGTIVTGYGIIEQTDQGLVVVDFGCIRPPPKLPLPQRYLVIFNGISHLIEKHAPSALSVETQFVQKNIQSAMKLGMARASVLLAAASRGLEIFEYAPRKAKKAVVGNGGASKLQVQRMIQMILKLTTLPEPEDAADALALAVCHANAQRMIYV
ncbi:MAG: crossover junction endodeoxyribonuclease RuvC [Verrucomicrobia bacterium]|nr:crossover junction endodeoxyribonuclease RuvC [Verrucomicrobiota bacterium]